MSDNPNFNDPRNIKRARKGQSRLRTHQDDSHTSNEHRWHDRHGTSEEGQELDEPAVHDDPMDDGEQGERSR